MTATNSVAAETGKKIGRYFFPRGLPGLEQCRYFDLEELPGNPLFRLLSAGEEEEIALIVVNPVPFFPEYRVELTAWDLEELEAKSMNELSIYTTVTVAEQQLWTNLAAPLLFNTVKQRGRQIILDRYIEKLRVPLPVQQ